MIEKEQINTALAPGRNSTPDYCILLSFIDLRQPGPLHQAASLLKEDNLQRKIVCVNTPDTKALEQQITEIDIWITHTQETTGVIELIRKLRSFRPSSICIAYRTDRAQGHLKLEMLASFVSDPPWKQMRLFEFFGETGKLRRLHRLKLYLRIWTKLFLLLGRACAASLLAAFIAVMLLLVSLISRPGERLGAPTCGNKE